MARPVEWGCATVTGSATLDTDEYGLSLALVIASLFSIVPLLIAQTLALDFPSFCRK